MFGLYFRHLPFGMGYIFLYCTEKGKMTIKEVTWYSRGFIYYVCNGLDSFEKKNIYGIVG